MIIGIPQQAGTPSAALSGRRLSRRFGAAPSTMRKWRHRDSIEYASHRPHTLYTILTPAQEAMVDCLRGQLLRPFGDRLAITRASMNPKASRSVLGQRLKRQGGWPTFEAKPLKPLRPCAPGFAHVDGKYPPAIHGESLQHRHAAIGRATRRVLAALKPHRFTAG